jgi:hypothetical protein
VKTLDQACIPRKSVFEFAGKDTVYDLTDLDAINADEFFGENHVTEGMRQLLTESFKRLEGRQPGTPGAFLLSQSMGGGKTHNLIALGLLAKRPDLRKPVMSAFYEPGALGAIRVVAFTGRTTDTPFGIWGEVARQLNRLDAFKDLYAPLRPPGQGEWVALLRGEPLLILLDELPPYFEAMRSQPVGATTLDTITTTALTNLLVAVTGNKLPNVCVVMTDLSGSAYAAGSSDMSQALVDLGRETSRNVVRIDPVRLNTNELYDILRVRLFESLPGTSDIEAAADGFRDAMDDAAKMGFTSAAPAAFREEIVRTYPFHPSIRDLFARFKENQGYQQTRALIRIMRLAVAEMWTSGAAARSHVIGAECLDLDAAPVVSEIRQINGTLEAAIAHDIANDADSAIAERIDAGQGREARDAATLVFLSSLSLAVNPVHGLTRDELVADLVAPGRDLTRLRDRLDQLQAEAWYLHATSDGRLLFKNTENLVAKLDSYTRGLQREQAEAELTQRLNGLFRARLKTCYQQLEVLPAIDRITLSPDDATLIIYRPAAGATDEVRQFWDHQEFKNRVLFLTGSPAQFETMLLRARELKAIQVIIGELRADGRRENDPQLIDADAIQTKKQSAFYMACRETFQKLLYPTRSGLTELELEPQYVSSEYDGEKLVIDKLKGAFKYRDETGADGKFKTLVEAQLWPTGAKETRWGDLKRRAAADPSWVLHHPRALDALRDELVRRDQWRLSGEFVERGPFEKPAPDVEIQQMSRDDTTGEVRLRIKVLNADAVLKSEAGPPTELTARLEKFELTTLAPRLWFRAVDTTDLSREGSVREWTTTVTLKHKPPYTAGGVRKVELFAFPGGSIRYTTDGSSPETSGRDYGGPIEVDNSVKVVLAIAEFDGVRSEITKFDLPRDGLGGVVIDPARPAVWRHRHRIQTTHATFDWLEQAAKAEVRVAGIDLNVQRDTRYISLATDPASPYGIAEVRDWADRLKDLLPEGEVTLTVEACHFARGLDLGSFQGALKLTVEPGEVQQ